MRKIYFFIQLNLVLTLVNAQTNSISAFLGVDGILSTPNYIPFWMRSDQFGGIPISGASASFVGAFHKDYDTSKRRLFDWSVGLNGRVNVGQITSGTLIEGYGKMRLSIFEFMAGRAKQIMGLVDTSLSSGAFSISGNALGIPVVQLSIPDYFSLPVLGKLFSVKGSYAYGWVGEVPIQSGHLVTEAKTYFFQQSFYGRLGKPNWRFHFKGGFNHQGFFGSEPDIFGSKVWKLSPWQTFEYAQFAKDYNGSKVGKQMGSVDFAAEYDFDNVRITLYRQFFIYVGAFFHFANLRDGLNGLSFINKKQGGSGLHWNKILFEFFSSMDQAGYPWSITTPSGAENYYNHWLYSQGWSYKSLGLGNPFITPYTTTRANLPNYPLFYFNNNRVLAFYTGAEASVAGYVFSTRLSYSLNYGTFATSPWGMRAGGHQVIPTYPGLFGEVNQFSGYVEVKKVLKHGLGLGFVASIDNGGLFYNSAGFIFKCSKTF